VSALYLVVTADLTASQLVLYGAASALVIFIAEVPAGVIADTISRKWSLVLAHLVMGVGMVMLGLVTAFPLLLATQLFWGLGWTFSSGADVAWITDELDRPDRIARVLVARARWEQIGSAIGIVGFGALAWALGLGPAAVTAGLAMILLGLAVAARFPERNFTRTRTNRWRAALAIFRRGVALARGDRQIRVVLAATMLVNGASIAYDFAFRKQLLDLGFPTAPDPIVWFALLGLVTLALAILALRIVEARIDGAGVARRTYALAALIGALGLVVLGQAPDDFPAIVGVLLITGLAAPVTRAVSVIWVNRRTTSDVRATVHSFLQQAESVGEMTGGLALALLAAATDLPLTLTASGLLLLAAALLVARSRD
jgi:predicted MFS family arabinose efflux permease